MGGWVGVGWGGRGGVVVEAQARRAGAGGGARRSVWVCAQVRVIAVVGEPCFKARRFAVPACPTPIDRIALRSTALYLSASCWRAYQSRGDARHWWHSMLPLSHRVSHLFICPHYPARVCAICRDAQRGALRAPLPSVRTCVCVCVCVRPRVHACNCRRCGFCAVYIAWSVRTWLRMSVVPHAQ